MNQGCSLPFVVRSPRIPYGPRGGPAEAAARYPQTRKEKPHGVPPASR